MARGGATRPEPFRPLLVVAEDTRRGTRGTDPPDRGEIWIRGEPVSQSLDIPGIPEEHRWIPDRNTFVHADYLLHAHRDMKQAVWEEKGVRFIVHGVSVEIGMIPPERRWAVDAEGVFLPREKFRAIFIRNYETFYAIANAKGGGKNTLDDPTLEHIPSPRDYLRMTLDSEGHLIEIGYDPRAPRPVVSRVRRGADEADPVIDVAVLSASGFERKPIKESEALAELRAENEALAQQVAEARAATPDDGVQAKGKGKGKRAWTGPKTPEELRAAQARMAKARAVQKAKRDARFAAAQEAARATSSEDGGEST